MAADTTLNTGTGGDTIRAVDKTGIKAQVVILDIGGAGAESLLTGTLPVSAASLPLPTGAATAARQDTGNTSLSSIDGKITAVNTGAVVVSSSALPSGASTAARQDTGNTSVASIDTKMPAQGQALAAASVPVVLTAIQQTALTPPVAIAGFALEAGHLATIDTSTAKIPSQGQALAVASLPVVLTAIQQAALTPPAAIAGFALEAGHLATIDTSTARLDVALSTRLKPADTLAAVTNLATIAGTAPTFGTGVRAAGTLRVTVATDDVVPITNANLDVALSTRLKPADTLTAVTTVATVTAVTAITNALPTGTNSLGKISDITTSVVPGTAATNLGKAEDAAHTTGDTGVLSLGIATDVPNLPTTATVNANTDYAGTATDRYGVVWTRKRQLVTYSASYRLGDATAGQTSLTFTFVANTNKQLGTIYHAAAATKTVKLRKVVLSLSTGAAGIFDFEIRALSATTAPATGNPAITPRQHDPADGAAEATCLALPTTAGSLVGADAGTVSETITWNSAAATASGNPSGLAGQDIMLYEYKDGMEMKPLSMRAATAEGFAVNGRCTQAVALRYSLHFIFTEE